MNEYKLYKIVGEKGKYMYYEYVCPDFKSNKIAISKPNDLVEFKHVDNIKTLYNEGLIPESVMDVLSTSMDWVDNYMLAVKMNDTYISTLLKCKDEMLYGNLPDKFTRFKRPVLLSLYYIVYFSLVFLILKLLIS